jgi:hypothetical protein
MIKNVLFCFYALLAIPAIAAQPTVTLPQGMNLGATSFYDGFGGNPGESAWQTYIGYSRSTALKDNEGNDLTVINEPGFTVYSMINQYSYLFDTDMKVLGGHLGIDTIIPMAALDTSFKPGPPYPGLQLQDNGTGLGDPTVSLFIQYDPINVGGHPVFVSRLSAGVTMPFGKYDADKDFNTGNNIWSFDLYYAMTLLLGPKWSISLRPQYYYNFKNDDPASSFPLDAGVEDIQPGQSFSMNYNVSYKLNDNIALGLGGYYLKQITDDKINGKDIQNSKEKAFGFGPEFLLDLGHHKFFLTAFRESNVENRFELDNSVILRWLHTF